ncbi:hypothetical protein CBS147339_4366 [Penicillium roqueforti]|nr:hypothetical protein DTO012A8_8913 [Penicillium roqueforti]KAI3078201.1 hypothetical protein CBS147339_4366 [Penicillium roqueforti]KAI3104080.1 hypothetical protein CBS147338_1901 [Penicillium roqueforti]KAI3185145.1 hypothetical protein DTO032C6_5521 [Penicillium roqueforti]
MVVFQVTSTQALDISGEYYLDIRRALHVIIPLFLPFSCSNPEINSKLTLVASRKFIFPSQIILCHLLQLDLQSLDHLNVWDK